MLVWSCWIILGMAVLINCTGRSGKWVKNLAKNLTKNQAKNHVINQVKNQATNRSNICAHLPRTTLYKSITKIVASISHYELEDWPELLNYITAGSNLNDASYLQKLKLTELLNSLTEDQIITNILAKNHLSEMIDLIKNVLNSNHEIEDGDSKNGLSIHANICESIVPIFKYLSEYSDPTDTKNNQISSARSLLPKLISTIEKLIYWEENLCGKYLCLCSELCEIEVEVLDSNPGSTDKFITIEIAQEMATLCLKIALDGGFEEETRVLALDTLQMLIKKRGQAFLEHETCQIICQEMQNLLVTADISDEEMMAGDRNIYSSAIHVIDQLGMAVPAEQMVEILAEPISNLISSESSNENQKRAGFLILSAIVEGCYDLLKSEQYLNQLVPVICQHLDVQDDIKSGIINSRRVRSSAFFCLAQFSEYLEPEIAAYAKDIMPYLLNVIEAGPKHPDFQEIEVTKKIYCAVENFVESMAQTENGEALDGYLDVLMKALINCLRNDANGVVETPMPHHIIASVVTIVGAIAESSKEKFTPFTDEIFSLMQKYLPDRKELMQYINDLERENENDSAARILNENKRDAKLDMWYRATETIGAICRAANSDIFINSANRTFQLAVDISESFENNMTNPEMIVAAFSIFASLTRKLEQKMESNHLEKMAEILFKVLDNEDHEIADEKFEDMEYDDDSDASHLGADVLRSEYESSKPEMSHRNRK